jgi:hypothetical protein
MADHTVYIWLTPQTITITPQPDGTWLATGMYKGAPIEARSRSEANARRMWLKKARRMDHPPHPAELNEL